MASKTDKNEKQARRLEMVGAEGLLCTTPLTRVLVALNE